MAGRKRETKIHPPFLQTKIGAGNQTAFHEPVVSNQVNVPAKLTFEQWVEEQPLAARLCVLILADNDLVYKHVTDGNMTTSFFIELKKLARNLEKEYPKEMASQLKSAKSMLR